jgi:hypothetical protein
MLIITVIVDALLLVLTAIFRAPPILDSLLIFLILLLTWVVFIAVLIGSLIYLVIFFKRNFIKAFTPIYLNILTIAIVITVPLAEKWESKVFSSHLKEYETVIAMVKRGELPNAPYVNLPHQLKHLASFLEVHQPSSSTMVVFFVKDGLVGRYGGYCYAATDQPSDMLYLRFGRKLSPHWYSCFEPSSP